MPLPPLQNGKNNLIDYLKQLLSDLMSTPEGKVTPVKLKILVNYSFTPGSESITLPVVLISPTVFSEEDVQGTGTGIKALNEGIINWFTDNTPIQNLGELTYSITFYSSIDGNNTLPLLTLDDITLLVSDVADISTLSPS